MALSEAQEKHTPRWVIGPSIAMEIDQALRAVGVNPPIGGHPPEFAAWIDSLPDDWRADWQAMLGEPGDPLALVATSAYLAGTLQGSDYSPVTLPARELSVDDAIGVVAKRMESMKEPPRDDLPPGERLVDLLIRMKATAHTVLGFPDEMVARQKGRWRLEMERVPRILRGGDLAARFWHWLDRFYFEFYHPWRTTRAEALQVCEMSARAALGTSEKSSKPLDFTWLPATNPLLRFPELSAAVHDGRAAVHLWVEPFGLADTWDLWPGLVLTSFAEPGPLFENFRAFAEDVASRAKALGDPTRLVILRMIRHFAMVNTEIAAFLGLARPTVSVHAGILQRAGLIRSRREGRVVRHEIVPAEVRRLFRDLETFLDLPEEE